MNTRKSSFITIIVLVTTWLAAGCGALQPTPAPTALPPVRLTAPPTFPPSAVPSVTASVTPLLPTPTLVDPAKDTIYAFFAALAAGDYDAAAGLYSNFSLMVDEVTRGEAASALKQQVVQDGKITGWEVRETRAFDSRTTLVHVMYTTGGQDSNLEATPTPVAAAAEAQPSPTVTLASGSADQTRQAEMVATNDARPTPTPVAGTATPTGAAVKTTAEGTPPPAPKQVDAWWPVRLENGQWRINRNNVVDFQTLDVPAQTTSGLTVKPVQLTRYSDRLRLTLLVQNQTSSAIVLGQANEVLATFLFGDQQIPAENTRLIFDRLRSYPDTHIDLPGLYETFPSGIIIRQWKNLKVKPWFEFNF